MVNTKREKFVLILFFLLPFHVFIIYSLRHSLGFSDFSIAFIFIKMWKEFVVVILVLYTLNFRRHIGRKQKIAKVDLWILLFVFLGGIYLLAAQFNIIAIWSFRSLFFCFSLYFLGRIIEFDILEIYHLLFMLFLLGIITSIFGIIQVNFLGLDFLKEMYGATEYVGLYAFGYDAIRAQSTFVNSHEFGLFLVFNLFSVPFLLMNNRNSRKFKRRLFIGVIIILVGLFYSYSRSSILILLLGYGLYVVKNSRYFLYFVLFGFLIYVIVLNIGIIQNIIITSQGYDPSSEGHFWVIQEALRIVSENPVGIGIGKAGVVVRRFISSAPQFEGEWFNIIVQLGVLGGLLYFIINIILLKKIFFIINRSNKKSLNYELSFFMFLIIIGMILRDLILPRDQMNFWFGWFMVGTYVTLIQKKLQLTI